VATGEEEFMALAVTSVTDRRVDTITTACTELGDSVARRKQTGAEICRAKRADRQLCARVFNFRGQLPINISRQEVPRVGGGKLAPTEAAKLRLTLGTAEIYWSVVVRRNAASNR